MTTLTSFESWEQLRDHGRWTDSDTPPGMDGDADTAARRPVSRREVPAIRTVRARTDRYDLPVPLYEYRCRSCDDVFELRRPMSESGEPTVCPSGHSDTVRLLSMFARAGSGATTVASVRPTGGSCCGGGCGCS